MKIGHCKGEGRGCLYLHVILLKLYTQSYRDCPGAQGPNQIRDFAGSPANGRSAALQNRGQSSAYAKMGEVEG